MARSMKFLLAIAAMNVFCLCAVDVESPKARKKTSKHEMKSWDPWLLTLLTPSTMRTKTHTLKKAVERTDNAVTNVSTEEIIAGLPQGFVCQSSHSRRTTPKGQFIGETYETLLRRDECSQGCDKTRTPALSNNRASVSDLVATEKDEDDEACLHRSIIPIVRYSESPEVFLAIQKACVLAEQKQKIQSQRLQCAETETELQVTVALCEVKA